MGRRLAAVALVAGGAFALLPVTTASAYCSPLLLQLTGYCTVCEIVTPDQPCPR